MFAESIPQHLLFSTPFKLCLCCGAVDCVAGALQEGDTGFDFLGPVQADSIMLQVAEGKSCCICMLGDALLSACVCTHPSHCAAHAYTYVGLHLYNCSTAQRSTTQHSKTQHSKTQHSTAQHGAHLGW